MKCRLVAYLRVPTAKQGRSGLGWEAQEAAVGAHAASSGCEIVGTYTEVEASTHDDLDNRPELRKAIAHARRAKATLIIAKLDRLARSVYVTALLHKSGVPFVCCNNPNANRLTIQILAAVAEDEARRISERTKAALAAYKARGGLLGGSRPECRNLTAEGRKRGARRAGEVATRNAREAYEHVGPVVRDLRNSGLSLRQIAARLDGSGHTTRTGRAWNPVQVSRLLAASD
jgi:DNA invertase Pin-like site-specific DNA recombinase